jgi:transglutaminase-like putative cysteine protease
MMRLRIEHATGFRYPGDVGASYNEARMLPSSTDAQFVLSSQLDIDPSTSVNYYADYFGTRVAAFDVLAGTVRSTSRRARSSRCDRGRSSSPRSAGIASPASLRAIETVEMLGQSGRTEPHPEVAEIARSIAAQHDNPGRAALAIATAIGDAMEYMPGITGVHSTGAEAWGAEGRLSGHHPHHPRALREVGIPARYVSGYLHPNPHAEVGVAVTGESHAWVEWFTGDWQGFDSTNRIEIGDRHVARRPRPRLQRRAPLRGVRRAVQERSARAGDDHARGVSGPTR